MVMSEKIQKARINAGLSRVGLAKAVMMTVHEIKCYETGLSEPGTDRQIRLARALGISLYYLRQDECQDPHQFIAAQQGMIDFYNHFGNDALIRYEARIMNLVNTTF